LNGRKGNVAFNLESSQTTSGRQKGEGVCGIGPIKCRKLHLLDFFKIEPKHKEGELGEEEKVDIGGKR